MSCPACKPDEPCSACLTEELARRNQQHNLQKVCDAHNGAMTAILAKRTKGRPRKPKDELLVSLHVSVHPLFPEHLDANRSAGRGIAIEQAFGFTRPTTGRKA